MQNKTPMNKYLFAALLCASSLSLGAQNTHNYELSRSLNLFNQIYKTLDLYYVDSLRPTEQVGEAIDYMLSGLDPYTAYYPPTEAEDVQTIASGKYGGIGALISYSAMHDRCIIAEPYAGMPAAKAGLHAGDVILQVDSLPIAPRGSSGGDNYSSNVSSSLRGDPGTTITVRVDRPGVGELTFRFEREIVNIPSVPFYTMADATTGYILLTTFSSHSGREVRQALQALKADGAKSLILDLRDNGGGLAGEAVNIVNLFVPKGKLILTMKGKTDDSRGAYYTKTDPEDTEMPVVVLVDGSSASASEITCGALQDLDRAVVMGERTYGKGLVQQPHEMPGGGMLMLTTSHYYIPSGRCIQALDYYGSHSRGDQIYRTPDSLTNVFYTAGGRPVRDGGGITPDVASKTDSLPNLLLYLQASTEVTEFIALYRSRHPEIAPAKDFAISDEEYEEFKTFIASSTFTYDRQTYKALQELKKIARFEGYDQTAAAELDALEAKLEHDLGTDIDAWETEVRRLLNREICRAYYYEWGAYESELPYDKQVQEAIALLADPKHYNSLLGK